MQPNALLRDMNVGVSSADERCVEVLASGLPCYGGAQLAVDVTLRGFLTAHGESRIGSLTGAEFLKTARADKERKYTELTRGKRCRLVVLALSTGGRWSTEAIQFIQDLAWARARSVPPYMRASVAFAWQRRWARMLSVSAASAFANALVLPAYRGDTDARDGPMLELSELFAGRAVEMGGDGDEGGCCEPEVFARGGDLLKPTGRAAEEPLANGGRGGAASDDRTS